MWKTLLKGSRNGSGHPDRLLSFCRVVQSFEIPSQLIHDNIDILSDEDSADLWRFLDVVKTLQCLDEKTGRTCLHELLSEESVPVFSICLLLSHIRRWATDLSCPQKENRILQLYEWINHRETQNGETAMDITLRLGLDSVALCLICAGANINLQIQQKQQQILISEETIRRMSSINKM